MIAKLRKFRLISNDICYGPYPRPADEVEQHLSVNSKGPLCVASIEGVREISELIRDTLNDKSLLALDGNT